MGNLRFTSWDVLCGAQSAVRHARSFLRVKGTSMEPFVILAIAAVLVVILIVLWQQRSQRTTNRTTAEISNPPRQPARPAPSENEPLS